MKSHLQSSKKTRYPASFKNATWRCVLPVEDGNIGLAFDIVGGETVRMIVPLSHMEQVFASIEEYKEIYRKSLIQSDSESDRSNLPKSTFPESEK